ncbi:hypothetical protein MVES1_003567 [Malassezia vespertilionis]|uniref:Amino acid transporter transmembrane domain-containing protein n=1 Tax=Malassezia vespertilionis TaxID=2020962 RepID=A0A2N1J8U6_9BASI|nr:uncharacterized protein MVES1_003567 [Malassezia vespertilionis]PKI82956.1 hypothetical protein MVES_003141 [Malassezia vespertilionis]WFD08196.1 hypothetical protein MVES1_003567 [Malassezia vespertilionis]
MPGRAAIPVRGKDSRGRATQVREITASTPWRSSLDLVWSYSRSQAYFGDNITTSPSFVDRRWRGPSEAGAEIEAGYHPELSEWRTSAVSGGDASSGEEDTYFDQARVRDRVTTSLETEQYWRTLHDEQDLDLERGRPMHKTERKEGLRDGQDESASDSSSRSRSMSPKRLGLYPRSNVRPQYSADDHAPSCPPRDSSTFMSTRQRSSSRHQTQLRSAAPQLLDPYRIDEQAPLLRGRNQVPVYMNSVRDKSHGHRVSQPAEVNAPSSYAKSTFWQTWFNTVNAIVGVSILSMPLAFANAGWVGGVVIFLLCGWVTNYSGKVLVRILAQQPHLHTYADIGSYAFGPKMRTYISFLFCFEMWIVSVALVILMGDNLSTLVFGSVGNAWVATGSKVLCFVIVSPTLLMPLSFLSPVSLIGIVSILVLFVVIMIDGVVQKHAPGSLWEPAQTFFFSSWTRMPISFGLVMAGFSSHPVIPSLYRDMKDPSQFDKMLDLAYLTAAGLYFSVATIGYLMFGSAVSDEITRDLASTAGYPYLLTSSAVLLMTINPMTKFSLALRPVYTSAERWLGILEGVVAAVPRPSENSQSIDSREEPDYAAAAASAIGDARVPVSEPRRRIMAALVRTGLAVSALLAAIIVPNLERVMAFLGAFLTFNTCILGPLLANMTLFRSKLSNFALVRDLLILSGTFVLAMAGTLGALWPSRT